VVQLLLAAGASINAADIGGWTPLHSAARHGRLDVTALLLRRGADLRLRDDVFCMPLFFAAQEGCTALLQLLLEAWGQPEVPAADLVAAAKAAAFRQHMAALAQLVKELQRLHPSELPQLFEGAEPVSPAQAAAALADAWASDVSSLDKQRAAVRRWEEDVAQEKAAVQHLIVGMASVAKAAQEHPDQRRNKRLKQDPNQ
jgi:hypothetical protein